jgi:hypothetical protein
MEMVPSVPVPVSACKVSKTIPNNHPPTDAKMDTPEPPPPNTASPLGVRPNLFDVDCPKYRNTSWQMLLAFGPSPQMFAEELHRVALVAAGAQPHPNQVHVIGHEDIGRTKQCFAGYNVKE